MEKKKFRISLVFYPQKPNGYTVVCPELDSCFSEGDTLEEAQEHVLELVRDALEKEAQNEQDAELFQEGLGVEGKLFTEVVVEI